MNATTFNTAQLHEWIDRIQAGDREAQNALIREVGERLRRLTSAMLHRYPCAARWEETDDVLVNAEMRLLRALCKVKPSSLRDFFGLAAEQIRRELLDLVRHYQGPQGMGAHHGGGLAGGGEDSQVGGVEPIDPDDPTLEMWTAFHQAVEKLPAEEREVVGLTFYHGWTQPDIASLLGVSERTVRHLWRSACQKLHQKLGGAIPHIEGGP